MVLVEQKRNTVRDGPRFASVQPKRIQQKRVHKTLLVKVFSLGSTETRPRNRYKILHPLSCLPSLSTRPLMKRRSCYLHLWSQNSQILLNGNALSKHVHEMSLVLVLVERKQNLSWSWFNASSTSTTETQSRQRNAPRNVPRNESERKPFHKTRPRNASTKYRGLCTEIILNDRSINGRL